MRPPRMLILTLFLAASLFVLCRSVASVVATSNRAPSDQYPPASSPPRSKSDKSIWGFMYYNTPFSLFPPNAAISLTDDNSTSFAARPAAFGPNFNPRGLSGQLWVGSGFVEDATGNAGELGCSDIPGWDALGGMAAMRPSPRVAKAQSVGAGHMQKSEAFSTKRQDDAQYKEEFDDIVGKVVLLMRGGCGFLEKVMWAQRRGAIAVIVGDNQKGGPLIQMFAHGEEVDNVTIPSVFTARTTAQLLSSLTQPGSFIEDTMDDYGKPVLKVRQGPVLSKMRRRRVPAHAPIKKRSFFSARSQPGASRSSWGRGWLSGILGSRRSVRPHADDIRPPSSNHQDWVLVEDWKEDVDDTFNGGLEKTPAVSESSGALSGALKAAVEAEAIDESAVKKKKKKNEKSQAQRNKELKVGKLAKEAKSQDKTSDAADAQSLDSPNSDTGLNIPDSGSRPTPSYTGRKKPGILSKVFNALGHSNAPTTSYIGEDDEDYTLNDIPDFVPIADSPPETHEGLWVTITPTSSASPFFDTLLVLVISPLVTLTVVYALLILRARIRRRRWRAPKSVVERLPVRTYRTVVPSPVLSPRVPSSSAATPTTPLLSGPTRPRPRSRTTTAVPEIDNLLAPSPAIPTPGASPRDGPAQPEKGSGGFSAEWKKYMGRQVECVVCLEEYVDGVSRVMSLPCGHEFHVDCITPWLTTRRRTCPICKGDVVRSLARRSSSSPRYEPYHDDSDDEPEAEGSRARSMDHESDLEQGILSDEQHDGRSASRHDGWLGLLSGSFGSRSQDRSRSPADRNR